MPLDENYNDEDNISTAKEFRPPSEWNQVVSGSSNGHFRITRPPHNIGLGWGDWDLYRKWESYGRRVTPDMVEKGDWVNQISSFNFASANNSNSITRI
ncbi:hypothetical protein E0Z10_g4073 [Xylaria hypoxylon]|uniref:Uncharacterized protein n=1 Tax=Xylaria hypoxylon TaxID=37992 RepID=A0A4Z0Z844_9PEZI|nr:hypothetical protein E0Z10_g4073 [Xylaria hypoxylon]